MARGISIHIGLNTLDQEHYSIDKQPLFEQLQGCVNDAVLMQRIAASRNFQTELFITKGTDADRERLATNKIFDRIRFYAGLLDEGDVFLLTFAGHGSQIENIGNDFEVSGYDQTMCFYDRMVIDDELGQLWSLFKPGVRILVISDSCHSGTVFYAALMQTMIYREITASINTREALVTIKTLSGIVESSLVAGGKNRELISGGGMLLFKRHQTLYSGIFQNLSQILKTKKAETFNELIECSLLKFSACQDHEKAEDGAINGVFTTALKKVWFGTETPNDKETGGFTGNYLSFFKLVSEETNRKNSSQNPQFFKTAAEAIGIFPKMNEKRLDNFIKSAPLEI